MRSELIQPFLLTISKQGQHVFIIRNYSYHVQIMCAFN